MSPNKIRLYLTMLGAACGAGGMSLLATFPRIAAVLCALGAALPAAALVRRPGDLPKSKVPKA